MANIKSAKKRILVTAKKTLKNKMIKSKVKTAISKFEKNLSAGNIDESKKTLKAAIRELDKAYSKGVLHRNTIARKKSRLCKKLNTLDA
ncbi:30S ribosomal protein S20 [Aceticella autotrophica]|uniref:Small ribosomal subunit protein bS20 n=1 Tax=Aceticella autotrophica TaxID=2755338 RepID=A0A975GA28_9THEO|nr:30S ribosomal protein S20 [Aceticella autotrophica]MDI6603584.1 30S ribosomal protein S20 [Thermoanaerobacteraceae bacterium]QSZ26757.1 30S ribosomal protein S20 [Aceticella autotrophica]